MFSKRLISSIFLWTALLVVLFYLNALASALLCCLLTTVALAEFYDMLRRADMPCSKRWGLITGVILSAGTWGFSAGHARLASLFEVILLVILVLGLLTRHVVGQSNSRPIAAIANTLLGVLYIPWLFSFFPKIRYLYSSANGEGPGWLFIFYLVVVTKFCDIGAYTFGRIFGRHPMAPSISPKKTWEGLIGGLAVALAASVGAYAYLKPRVSVVGFGAADAAVLGIFLGGMGVIGDLAESVIKRQAGAKDSGGLLPGIGGALDLIDSLLFTAPILYAWLVLKMELGG
ncbi:MAG: phosphatidate cytidylyltransferase [Verrucomicrobiae bacterium]|nr:phosphatidate cytidylyltransferase [Verrucomicrobiae bacterium]